MAWETPYETKAGRRWRVSWREPNGRIKSHTLRSPRSADNWSERLSIAERDNTLPEVVARMTGRPIGELTLRDGFRLFGEEYTQHELAAHTRRNYSHVANKWILPYSGDRPLAEFAESGPLLEARDLCPWASVGNHTLKGIDEPVEVFRADREIAD